MSETLAFVKLTAPGKTVVFDPRVRCSKCESVGAWLLLDQWLCEPHWLELFHGLHVDEEDMEWARQTLAMTQKLKDQA